MRDVVAEREKKFKKILKAGRISAISTLAAGLFLSGCNGGGGVETFCAEMPKARSDLNSTRKEIVSYTKPVKSTGRRIASVTVANPEPPSEKTQEAWVSWSEKALKRTQWARDNLEGDKRGKKAMGAINDASLSLVSVRGFLDQQKWKKAANELDKIDEDFQHAYDVACIPTDLKSARKPKK